MRTILIITYLSILTTIVFSQESVAVLAKGLDSINLILNDSIVGRVMKNEKFITFKPEYESDLWQIWTRKGENGFTDRGNIILLQNEKIFKLNTDTVTLFQIACSNYNLDNFNYYGIDNYCNLVKQAANINEQAFLRILELNNIVDGGAAEINNQIAWNIFNIWSDSEFNDFLTKQDYETQLMISRFLVYTQGAYPITNTKFYYSEYYPKTWNTINSLIEIKK
ncbi:hypothetical protein [Saccharicrinis sp. FJH54]|uniref:hypothetical protein n=1 Tax=Saccharicrinis sp. FJH54 TaxID=3344665 RepID=UPI0035D4AE82